MSADLGRDVLLGRNEMGDLAVGCSDRVNAPADEERGAVGPIVHRFAAKWFTIGQIAAQPIEDFAIGKRALHKPRRTADDLFWGSAGHGAVRRVYVHDGWAGSCEVGGRDTR